MKRLLRIMTFISFTALFFSCNNTGEDNHPASDTAIPESIMPSTPPAYSDTIPAADTNGMNVKPDTLPVPK